VLSACAPGYTPGGIGERGNGDDDDRRGGRRDENGTACVQGALPFTHVTSEVAVGDDAFVERLLSEQAAGFAPDEKMVLCGLHTCGDLGGTLLRAFARTPSCKALVLVRPSVPTHVSLTLHASV
jgi:hypothetical protein